MRIIKKKERRTLSLTPPKVQPRYGQALNDSKQKSDDQQMHFHWFKRKGTLIIHQGCVSCNIVNCPTGSFAQKEYKWSYLLSSQTNWTRKAFLLHKAVILRLMADFATRKLIAFSWKLAKDWLSPVGSTFYNGNWQWCQWSHGWRPLSRNGSSPVSGYQPRLKEDHPGWTTANSHWDTHPLPQVVPPA